MCEYAIVFHQHVQKQGFLVARSPSASFHSDIGLDVERNGVIIMGHFDGQQGARWICTECFE